MEFKAKYETILSVKLLIFTNKESILQMAKSKGTRLIITLECTECRSKENTNGVSRYTTKKNRKNTPDRLALNKFCKFCKKHTIHKEIK